MFICSSLPQCSGWLGSAGWFFLGPSRGDCHMAGAGILRGFPGLDAQGGFLHSSGGGGPLRVAPLLLDEDMGFRRQETQASRPFKAVPSTGTSYVCCILLLTAALGLCPDSWVGEIECVAMGPCQGTLQRNTWEGIVCGGHLWENTICHIIPRVRCIGTDTINV